MSSHVDQWLTALETKAAVSRRSRSIGIYEPNTGIIRVKQEKGNSLNTIIGKSESGILSLYPEESLYLIQRGVLQVYQDDLLEHEIEPIPLQQMILQHVDLNIVILYNYVASNPEYIICRSLWKASSSCFAIETMYDVFLQSKQFRKTQPGKPAFRIALCDFHKPFPPLDELLKLHGENEPVGIKLAVVDTSNVVLMYDIIDTLS